MALRRQTIVVITALAIVVVALVAFRKIFGLPEIEFFNVEAVPDAKK